MPRLNNGRRRSVWDDWLLRLLAIEERRLAFFETERRIPFSQWAASPEEERRAYIDEVELPMAQSGQVIDLLTLKTSHIPMDQL